MQADAISIFPVKLLRNYINMAKLYFHRTASPVRPIKSFSALLNFISASSCWDLRTCALRDEVSSLRCNSDTISWISNNAASLDASYPSTDFNIVSASSNFFCFGPIFNKKLNIFSLIKIILILLKK